MRGLLIVLALAGLGQYGCAAAGPGPGTATAAASGQAAAGAESERAPLARDALQALKDVQAATRNRQAFKDYNPRLVDAKTAVARYLEGAELAGGVRARPSPPPFTPRAGGRGLRPNPTAAELAEVGRDPALEACSRFMEFLGTARKRSPKPKDDAHTRGFLLAGFAVGTVWACAADRIAEAERLLAKRPWAARRPAAAGGGAGPGHLAVVEDAPGAASGVMPAGAAVR